MGYEAVTSGVLQTVDTEFLWQRCEEINPRECIRGELETGDMAFHLALSRELKELIQKLQAS